MASSRCHATDMGLGPTQNRSVMHLLTPLTARLRYCMLSPRDATRMRQVLLKAYTCFDSICGLDGQLKVLVLVIIALV